MVAVLVRAVSTVATVVIAVVVSATLGESASGKIWAAVFIAAFIALVEWALIWTPKHVALARRLLDPRSSFVGVWLQVVRRVVSATPPEEEYNRFALFWVDYRSGSYHVSGSAFDSHGTEFARWSSTGSPDFAPDGQSMTYFWQGEVLGLPGDSTDIDRTGVTNISIRDRKGRVDHVGLSRILLFDVEPVSPELLADVGLPEIKPQELKDAGKRSRFTRAYAARFVAAGPAPAT